MVKRIAFFTSCRGDIGILTPLIKKIYKTKGFEALLFVGGTHLSRKYGYTLNEIKQEGLRITGKYKYLTNFDDPYNLSRSTNKSGAQVATFFKMFNFHFVCILGDRFERLPIILNSLIFKKPIIHLHGGEITQGLIDEQVRHLTSKASHLHFVICKDYENNLIKIGEQKSRIFNSGALAIDNILNKKQKDSRSLIINLGLDPKKPFVILTYHPVSLEFKVSAMQQIKNIFLALKKFDLQIIITAPGIEVGSNELISFIKSKIKKDFYKKAIFVESLGFSALYSLIPKSQFVIGNSSFGIIEVPFFKVPTINIGDRQKGRFLHESVIGTRYDDKSISRAIKLALSKSFRIRIKKMKYHFGNGKAADKILKVIKKTNINQKLLRKPFV